MMVGSLLLLAGSIYLVLGFLHALYTLLDLRNPTRLVPDDPAVTTAMENSRVRLTRGATTMWSAWVGFNLSHSLGALLFGAACCIVAACFRVFAFEPWALLALALVSAGYLAIGLKYWFRVPIAGAAIATGCLTAAWLLYLL
jgi:hypothetical protein